MITVISSTNRNNALSLQIAEYYLQLLKEKGADCQLLDLRDLPVDFIETALYDNKGNNPEFNVFQDKILKSEKLVFIIPEYNGSFPGVLKAFIDGLAFPKSFKGKKAAVVGISAGDQGAALAMSHLVDILNYLGVHVLAKRPRLPNADNEFEDGTFSNPRYDQRLRQQVEELLVF